MQTPEQKEIVNFDRFLTKPKELSEENKKEISDKISELKQSTLNVERLPLQLLRLERAQYPIIDPLFLRKSIQIEYKGNQIQVPRFSVYPKSKEGFDNFRISMWRPDFLPGLWGSVCVRFNEDIPVKLRDELALSLEFANYCTPKGGYKFSGVPKKIKHKYSRLLLRDDLFLTTTFAGIIPKETKEKLEKAESIFDEGIFLVAETKPKQWFEKKISKDPLIVGVSDLTNKCYLIDRFNTTDIEDYVSREFTT